MEAYSLSDFLQVEITAEFLFSQLKAERSTGELTPLPENFYLQAKEELDKMKSQGKNESDLKQAENAASMFASLKERRKQKLLIYLAYGKQLPQPAPREEALLYAQLSEVLKGERNSTKVARLKILADVPEVITTEGKKIGPFKKGEVVEATHNGDVEFMLKNSIAALNE